MSFKSLVGDFKPQRKGVGKVLGKLEATVMEIVWRQGEVCVRDVHEELSLSREIAYTTVMTIMGRLADKKLLRKEKRGIAFFYTPVYSKKEFTSIFVGEVLDGILEEFSDVAYLHLIKHLNAEDEEKIARLEELINQRLRKGD